MELWGGPECTLNRVGDRFRDQFRESGHDRRLSDLDLFASLGITALRYPVAWERVAPDHPDACDWRWSDERLGRLRTLGIRPIVGLVHHGSGPRYTNLLADDFACGLAEHARKVAERYPWIEDWTPVNEPLTTARFAGLYGHWYPHARDERSFWLALLNQVEGVQRAMAAVRRVNPAARLIQTDDLGRTYATEPLADQADFDNTRRWMSWDLLCGRVMPGHPFRERLEGYGFGPQLARIAEAPCPPDIVGINHYLTSDRFLDHRVHLYPEHLRGSNGRVAFADTEAVRVLDPAPPGLAGAIREAWDRYRLPIAVTEVHNGCTREEQMRWMADAWEAATGLQADGVDVRAVTSWALLGSYGWDTLLTRQGSYEPGVWDLSSGEPRPTAMVPLLRALSGGSPLPSPCAGRGWWNRPIRLAHPPAPQPVPLRGYRRPPAPSGRPILIVGQAGAFDLLEHCRRRGLPFARVAELDDENPAAALARHHPWAVIASEPIGHHLAELCRTRGIALCGVPSDPAALPAMLDRVIDEAAAIAAA